MADLETFGNQNMPKSDSNYICGNIDQYMYSKNNFKKNIDTILNDGNKIMPKLCSKYFCEICDYNTSKKSSITSHYKSMKHIGNQNMPKIFSNTYTCKNCNRQFMNRSGLWKHKKVGNIYVNEDDDKKNNSDVSENMNDIVKFLMKENSELKQMMMESHMQILELIKTGTHNNSNNNNSNNTNNSHNKSFNLQLFLNETCKDALNLNDFISSLNITLDDFERFGTHGYVEGISKIFIKGLKNLEINKRPIHCTDLKREVIYLKEKNVWEKEDEERNRIKKAIKTIAHKNTRLIPEWQKENPTFMDSNSKKNTKYMKILMESMGASTKEEDESNCNKIIKNILKEVTIDK
jgi:hypothetical protein